MGFSWKKTLQSISKTLIDNNADDEDAFGDDGEDVFDGEGYDKDGFDCWGNTREENMEFEQYKADYRQFAKYRDSGRDLKDKDDFAGAIAEYKKAWPFIPGAVGLIFRKNGTIEDFFITPFENALRLAPQILDEDTISEAREFITANSDFFMEFDLENTGRKSSRKKLFHGLMDSIKAASIDLGTYKSIHQFIKENPGCRQNKIGQEISPTDPISNREIGKALKLWEALDIIERKKKGATYLVRLANEQYAEEWAVDVIVETFERHIW